MDNLKEDDRSRSELEEMTKKERDRRLVIENEKREISDKIERLKNDSPDVKEYIRLRTKLIKLTPKPEKFGYIGPSSSFGDQ